MSTLKTISEALKLIDTKKENLKKAYDELQSHSSLLSSSPLIWSELDSHFTSIQNSLNQRFQLLESLESQKPDLRLRQTLVPICSPAPSQTQNLHKPSSSACKPTQNPGDPSSSNPPTQSAKEATLASSATVQPVTDPSSSKQNGTGTSLVLNWVSDSVMPRGELSVLCEKMDGKGLRNYIIDNLKDKYALQLELPGALRCASDPPAMILDAIDGYFGVSGVKDAELRTMRRSCMLLLEQLRVISPGIGFKVREKAKNMAVEWRKSLMTDSAKSLEALGFLHFVAAYGLFSEFSKDELVEFAAITANNEEVPLLCRLIGLGDKISDLIQKLLEKGKHILAVKYIFEFNLADKIPPVSILKNFVDESKKLCQKICQEGNNSLKSLTEATAREIHALKSVIKVIENHKLDSEYPRESIEQRIQQLEKQKMNRKRPAPAPAVKPQPQQQQPQSQPQQQKRKKQKQRQKPKQPQQSGNKRPRTFASVGPAAVQKNVSSANSGLHQYQQPQMQPTGLLPEHPNPYVCSVAMPYGMVGPTPAVAGPSAGPYGVAGVPMGFSGDASQGSSHLYSSEPQVPSGYYDRSTTYGGYGLQHYYHPSYYPQ